MQHLSSVQISKESQADLAAVLKMDKCPIRMLDLSNTQLDVPALVKSLETNSTLRSLDVRKVPGTALEPRAHRGGRVPTTTLTMSSLMASTIPSLPNCLAHQVSTMVESFERIGAMLLKEDSVSCLAYMRCLLWNPSDGLSLLKALDSSPLSF